jgi:hypothetical protein
MIFYTRYKILDTRYKLHGVAALVTVLSLGGLIFTISLASSILAFWANQNIKSIRDSNKAFYAAYSGVQDALIKLERNKDFPSGSFNLSINGTSDVSYSVSNSNGLAITTSTASLLQINKRLQTTINISTTTGLITPTSTTELTL